MIVPTRTPACIVANPSASPPFPRPHLPSQWIVSEVHKRQARLDRSCATTSMFYLHLLLLNTAQISMVMGNLESHTGGPLVGVMYTW